MIRGEGGKRWRRYVHDMEIAYEVAPKIHHRESLSPMWMIPEGARARVHEFCWADNGWMPNVQLNPMDSFSSLHHQNLHHGQIPTNMPAGFIVQYLADGLATRRMCVPPGLSRPQRATWNITSPHIWRPPPSPSKPIVLFFS